MNDLLRHRRLPVAAALLAASLLGACQTGGGTPAATGSIPSRPARAIAFESIDGPPQPVFQRLVTSLSSEADQRNLHVVSREGDASYRVRGYLAASVEDGKGTVDWAWDVFDKDHSRVLRVAGTEQLGKGADVWSRCDDAVIGRIAAESLSEIAARLDAPAPKAAPEPAVPEATPAAPPEVRPGDGPPVAAADPFQPTLAFAPAN